MTEAPILEINEKNWVAPKFVEKRQKSDERQSERAARIQQIKKQL
jgi:hypothetical protein